MLGLATIGGAAVGGFAEALSVPTTLWSIPRTWVDGEVVTATMMNAHVRDNSLVIKVTRNTIGRLPSLSTTYLASLASSNLTGLVRAGVDNTFTAGRHRALGTGVRFRVPVGTDRWAGTKGVDAGGSVWVEGDYIHHVASNHTTEYRYLGVYVATPAGAQVGSVWTEGAYLHYIDADGDERYIYTYGTSGHSDASALGGSLWVETYLHGIAEAGTTEYPWHADAAHGDASPHNDSTSHSDSGPHGDSTSHDDYSAGHTDQPHEDHTDYVHVDISHNDVPAVHTDHNDHTDTGSHSDSYPHADHTDHTDSPAYNLPVVV